MSEPTTVAGKHDNDAAQRAWVRRDTDHDDRAAYMAGWDAALARVRERVRGIEPRHDDDALVSAWYFDGWNEVNAAVLAILDEEAGK